MKFPRPAAPPAFLSLGPAVPVYNRRQFSRGVNHEDSMVRVEFGTCRVWVSASNSSAGEGKIRLPSIFKLPLQFPAPVDR